MRKASLYTLNLSHVRTETQNTFSILYKTTAFPSTDPLRFIYYFSTTSVQRITALVGCPELFEYRLRRDRSEKYPSPDRVLVGSN
jgi:hypothetical protein